MGQVTPKKYLKKHIVPLKEWLDLVLKVNDFDCKYTRVSLSGQTKSL